MLAHSLARRGYRLVIPCRSLARADSLRSGICLHTPAAELDFVLCDLADLAAVQRAGQGIAERHPVIDLVVANAATVSPRLAFSPQGVERTFAVNHLSHFVLVQWLFGNLYTHSRILSVASSGARRADGDFLADLNYRQRSYRRFTAYANSKLANIAWAQQLGERLAPRQVACVSVHPGMLDTGIWPRDALWSRLLYPLFRRIYLLPPEHGARVLEHFAFAPEHNESRGFFDEQQPASPPAAAKDSFARELWDRSLALAEPYLPARVL